MKQKPGILTVFLIGMILLTGCAGPSTRVLTREAASQPYEIPQEALVLEEVNPFYLQESLDYLSGFSRENGSEGEEKAAAYIRRLLQDYGYETQLQQLTIPTGGINVLGTMKAPAPDADILIVTTSHDTVPESPGANRNASGVVTFLECARLLSRLPTDTELRFVSFGGSETGNTGSRTYVDTLSQKEQQRIIGVIDLEAAGYIWDDQIILGTLDGNGTLLGDLLQKKSAEVNGEPWPYRKRSSGDHRSFARGAVPSLMIGQEWDAYENRTSQDVAEIVDVEQLAGVVDILSQTLADIMEAASPSQLAKSRFMNPGKDGAVIQQRDMLFPFQEPYEQTEDWLNLPGELVSSNVDGAGVQVDTYRYRMKWFDVDQIILTDYHYFDGKLETISLDADGAGITFEDMKDRISSWYGEPVGENNGPSGTEYDWIDPVYGKFIALIPGTGKFDVELREYQTPETEVLSPERAELLSALVKKIFMPEDYDKLSSIRFYTDGLGRTDGYLTFPPGDSAESVQGELSVDIEDALDEDGAWRDRTETIRMLVHLYGQLKKPQEAPDTFEDDFMMFVLCSKPEERLLSFFDQTEWSEIRIWIRKNLQIEYEEVSYVGEN